MTRKVNVETPERLRTLVERIETLAERRARTRPRPGSPAERVSQLRDLLRRHIRVRAASLDAPLVLVILGPTGAGKSTLFNTLAGRAASPTGVLRPTTRQAVVLIHPRDETALLADSFAGLETERLRIVEDASIEPGLALVDAPDVDSIEHANRALTDHLVEAADLAIFVTTATRYADRVPWDVLRRARDRGLPMIVVVNRVPPEEADRREVLADVERLFVEAGLADVMDRSAIEPGSSQPGIALIGIDEGDIDREHESLRPDRLSAISGRIAALRADRDARIELAARALAGSLRGLAPTLETIADDCEHEAIDADALRRTGQDQYEQELLLLRDELGRAAFLRDEALRHWQRFVGADQITRFFSQGIGRLRGVISAVLRPARAPVAEVRAATTDDLVAVGRLHAGEAARRVATSWSDRPAVSEAIAADPALWGVSADFDPRLRRRLDEWIDGIGAEIQATGRTKRMLAQGASIGVNAIGTGVMLGTFIHTGGLTGAEVGVAAATAFLNQKLLAALFGEAAMAELIGNARRRLDEALAVTFAEELARFERLVPRSEELTGLATELRGAATEVRDLPTGLPRELRAVMATPARSTPE
jgi:energy-coupling factor transporter ATP-binding protein EcfA2